MIYNQEEDDYVVPRGLFEIGLGMCIPTMMAYAKPEQLRPLRAARRCAARKSGASCSANRPADPIWRRCAPAPNATAMTGSSTARRSGPPARICRTSASSSCAPIPNVPKHDGLTFFFLDMKSPGIEIRPIHQMSGARHFNEVFFTDVRVPDAQRLGAVGQGWKVSLTTLMNERLAVGDVQRPDVDDLIELSRTLKIDGKPAIRNAAVRERIAEWYAAAQGLKFTRFRTMTALSKGETPGPENSIHKLVNASKLQDIASYGMDLMGRPAAGDRRRSGARPTAMFQAALLSSPSARIAGGSDEILRNIIAERVLGLPADIRVDKDKPFNQVPTGKR